MQAFGKVLGNEKAFGRDYNIAASEPFQYRRAADYISGKLGIPTVDIPNPQYHSFSIDISRARREIGYSPEKDIEQMVDMAIEARAAT